MASYHTSTYCFDKLALSAQGSAVCRQYLQAFVLDRAHREVILSKPDTASREMALLAEAFVAEYGPEFWSSVLRNPRYIDGRQGLLLHRDQARIMQWVKELLTRQMMCKEVRRGSSARKPRKQPTPRKRCHVSPGAMRRAYNDNGEDDDDDDDGLFHKRQIKKADDNDADDDDAADTKVDARSKSLLNAASHTSSLGFERTSRGVKPERADRPASTPRVKTEPTDTNERGANTNTVNNNSAAASPTITTLASLGLSDHAIQYTRVYFKLSTAPCARSVGLETCTQWSSFCATLIAMCGLKGEEEVTITASCPWFDAPVPFLAEPGEDLHVLLGLVASWWAERGGEEEGEGVEGEWCPVTIEAEVVVKRGGEEVVKVEG
ncbi:MAG: hypothetical protein M1835_006257 [Candelina submexicana]|nr:MAG: hypothetical protein M1835_006257 [Candelina submexicana]